jgi:hypothetical protein
MLKFLNCHDKNPFWPCQRTLINTRADYRPGKKLKFSNNDMGGAGAIRMSLLTNVDYTRGLRVVKYANSLIVNLGVEVYINYKSCV